MVEMKGADLHVRRLRRMRGPEMVRQVGAALMAGGGLIEVTAAGLITEGAVSGKNHVPSKPGEPPNADTHMLDRSITTTQVAPLKVEVAADAPHAVALELGTSKMAERPYMRPAAQQKRAEAVDLVRQAVNKVVSGGEVVP